MGIDIELEDGAHDLETNVTDDEVAVTAEAAVAASRDDRHQVGETLPRQVA